MFSRGPAIQTSSQIATERLGWNRSAGLYLFIKTTKGSKSLTGCWNVKPTSIALSTLFTKLKKDIKTTVVPSNRILTLSVPQLHLSATIIIFIRIIVQQDSKYTVNRQSIRQ